MKPIVGMEAYVAPGSRFDKDQRAGEASNHMTLIAHNQKGYENLIKLTTLAYLEGFHYKPRVDKESLIKHSEGLTAFSGCLKGEIPTAIRLGDEAKALTLVDEYKISPHVLKVNESLIESIDYSLQFTESSIL
jgi:DNA polymerase-3 subunit alpha